MHNHHGGWSIRFCSDSALCYDSAQWFCTVQCRGVINGKAGKAAALPQFSDTLSLSQPEGAEHAHPLALLAKKDMITGVFIW